MSNNRKKAYLLLSFTLLLAAITIVTINQNQNYQSSDKLVVETGVPASIIASEIQNPPQPIGEKKELRDSIVTFAKKQLLVPYKYASCDPEIGFDCSGFVFYVFQFFNIHSPRTSSAFEKSGKGISLEEVQKGDVLVFTGTNASIREGGHVGIVISVGDSIKFIHSSSGRANGVTVSSLEEDHYFKRFLMAKDLISDAKRE